MSTEQYYRTNNTSLASYLISTGFKLLRIEYEERTAFFIFSNHDNELERHISEFRQGKAMVSVVAYEAARRELLSRIREGRS